MRILTKNVGVGRDFDPVEKYHCRVLVGLSLTGTVDKDAGNDCHEVVATLIQQLPDIASFRSRCYKSMETAGTFRCSPPSSLQPADAHPRLGSFM